MVYNLIPLLVAIMLGYMFWHAAFRMRRDRLKVERKRDRRHVILAPKHRIGMLLDRAFGPRHDPEWEASLVRSIEEQRRADAPD